MATFSRTVLQDDEVTSAVVYSKTPNPKRFITIDCDEFIAHYDRIVSLYKEEGHHEVNHRAHETLINIIDLARTAPRDLKKFISDNNMDFVVNITDKGVQG